MRRRFIADTWLPLSGHPTHAALTGEQAAHLGRVLRAQPGQVYDIVANGFLHRAEITSVSDNEIRFTLHEELEADAALPIHLLLAIFKFDHFEWAVEKATELGVARITPILARRTEKHRAQAAGKRVDRWRRIALEAAKQSRRTDAPEVADPTPLAAALAAETAPFRILLSETEQNLHLASALNLGPTDYESAALKSGAAGLASETWDSAAGHTGVPHPSRSEGREVNTSLALAIGPEGGWAPDEISAFTKHGWTHVTLGPRILRAETAAIAALAIAGAALQQPIK